MYLSINWHSSFTSKNLTFFRFAETLLAWSDSDDLWKNLWIQFLWSSHVSDSVCMSVSVYVWCIRQRLLSLSRPLRVPHRRLARLWFCRRHLCAITLRLLTTKSFHTAIIFTQYLAPRAWNSRPRNKETTDPYRNPSVLWNGFADEARKGIAPSKRRYLRMLNLRKTNESLSSRGSCSARTWCVNTWFSSEEWMRPCDLLGHDVIL